MRVVFAGMPHFGRRLVSALVDFAPGHSFAFFDPGGSGRERLRLAAALPRADVVVLLGGVSARSELLDLAVVLGKRLVMSWQGSDVSTAVDKAAAGRLVRRYIDRALHVTEAPWLRDELAGIGIRSEVLSYNWTDSCPTATPFERVGAYTYLGQDREAFYGWPSVVRLAERHPDVAFDVTGTRGEALKPPPNVRVHGWMAPDAVAALRQRVPIFVRMTEHDGYALSVREALACGSEVIWTVPHAHCRLARTPDEAVSAFGRAVADLVSRGLSRNASGMDHARRCFSRERVLKAFVERLEDVARG